MPTSRHSQYRDIHPYIVNVVFALSLISLLNSLETRDFGKKINIHSLVYGHNLHISNNNSSKCISNFESFASELLNAFIRFTNLF